MPIPCKALPLTPPLALAARNGTKTQTRRLVLADAPPVGRRQLGPAYTSAEDCGATVIFRGDGVPALVVVKPYRIGSRLWVRERARVVDAGTSNGGRVVRLRYEADGTESDWLPFPQRLGKPVVGRCIANGVHREGARTFLEVTAVRVERLQDISENDAKAEGIACLSKDGGRMYKYGMTDRDGLPGADDFGWPWSEWRANARDAFLRLWDSAYGTGAHSLNPWVWVVEFRGVEGA